MEPLNDSRRPRPQGKLEDAGQLDTTAGVFSTDNVAEAISLPDGDVIPRASCGSRRRAPAADQDYELGAVAAAAVGNARRT